MLKAPLLHLPYLPSRFNASRFASSRTGRVYTVSADDMLEHAAHEIETYRASNSVTTPGKPVDPERQAKKKRRFIEDLRETAAEVLRNISANTEPPKTPSSSLSPPESGTATPVLKETTTTTTTTTTTPAKSNVPLTDANGRRPGPDEHIEWVSDEHEYEDELHGTATLKAIIDKDRKGDSGQEDYNNNNNNNHKKYDDDEEDGDDDEDDDDDDDCDNDDERANKRTRHNNAKPFVRRKKQQSRKTPKRSPPEDVTTANRAVALRSINEELRRTGRTFRRGEAQKFRELARVLPPANGPEPDLQYIHVSPEITWNCQEAVLIEHIYNRVPMVVSCADTLKGQVLSEGIKFVRENMELLPSREFENYSIKHLHAFAQQILDALFMFGLIPICYEMDPITGQRWPYVPAAGTYAIKRHDVRGAVRYRFYWVSRECYMNAWKREPMKVRDSTGFRWRGRLQSDYCPGVYDGASGGVYDPTVEIIHNLGYEVLSSGAISSKIATLIATSYTRLRAQKARMTAESNAAAPTLFTEYDHAGEKAQSSNFQNGYYTSAAGHNPDGADIRDMAYQRDAPLKDAFRGMMNHFEAASGQDAAEKFGVEHEEYRDDLAGTKVVNPRAVTADGVQAPFATQYHVSSSRRIVNGPQSHMSGDFCQFMEFLEDEVCNVMGVPRTYINGTSIKASGDLIMNRFSDEVTRLKKIVSDILTHTYRVLFLDEDVTEYMASEFRLARFSVLRDSASAEDKSNILLTEEDLYETDLIKRVQVTFAKKPSESIEELFQLYGLGSITKQALSAELARRNNFNAQELVVDDGDEEIPVEMRRMLIPQFAEYIKLQFAQRQQDAQMKFQEKQMKTEAVQHEQEVKSKERVDKKKVKVDGAAKMEVAKHAGEKGGDGK